MIQAGRLRHRVTIQAASESRNDHGEMIQTWAAIDNGTVWAAIDPIGVAEQMASSQPEAIASHKVVMRHNGLAITPEHRLLFGSRILDIVSIVNVDERNRTYDLLCQEVL